MEYLHTKQGGTLGMKLLEPIEIRGMRLKNRIGLSPLLNYPRGADGCADELALGWDPTCVRACPMRALTYSQSQHRGRRLDPTFDDHGIGPRVAHWVRPTQDKGTE